MHPCIHYRIIYSSQDMEAAKYPSVGEWVKKLWYIDNGILLGCKKKKEILPFVTSWMDLENIMLSEISQ